MEKTKWIWQDGIFYPWEEAKVHVLTHALHYGSAVFEGIRCYKTKKGGAVFRLEEHMERLKYSSEALKMNLPYSPKELSDLTLELLRKNELEEGYIRPIAFFAYGKMGLNPVGAPLSCAIAAWGWGRYLDHDMVDVKTSSFVRLHPKSSITDAKIAGHYVNSIMAVLEIQNTPYHEALFLDIHGNIAEGPGENLFIVKKGKIYTPQKGFILPGITRDTVIQLAKDLGIEVIETTLSPDDVYKAEEAFYTGTAAEVTPIRSLDDRVIGQGKIGPITDQIKTLYGKVVRGEDPRYFSFLSFIS